jgi:hypothetical protein
MKNQIAHLETHAATVRLGGILSLGLASYFLFVTGISDLPRAFAFMAAFAVCFVFLMKSVVDVLTWSFVLAARISGKGLGRSYRATRGILFRWKSRR